MTTLTRKQMAEAVLAQLRGVGPQTVAEIQSDLGATKREVEGALYLLTSHAQVEHVWPVTSPLRYEARPSGDAA